jgi:signal transduction histidine kinase/tetratricopeptide (TPR) repeat protein
MMRTISLLALLISTLSLRGQKAGKDYADSLIASLPLSANDTIRVKALNKISLYYENIDIDIAKKYAALGMATAQKMNWQKAISAFHTAYANIYSVQGMYDSNSYHLQQALKISISLRDTVNTSVVYNNIGTTSFAQGDFVNATKYFMLALKLGEQTNNGYLISLATENMGNVYYKQQDYKKSLAFTRISLLVRQKEDMIDLIPNSLLTIGMNYKGMNMQDSALWYFNAALALSKDNKNKAGEATALSNIAETYAYKKDFIQAVAYSLQSKKIWDDLDPNHESALENLGTLGSYYLQSAKDTSVTKNKPLLLQSAKKYLEEALQKSNGQKNLTTYTFVLESLAEVNALTGDYKSAYSNYRKYNEQQDSLFSQENKNKIAAATSQLEIDKKNTEIALQTLTISNQKKQKFFLIGGLLLLATIGGLLFYQSRTRKKTNTTLMVLNNQLDDANKVKAKFFAILSHDLRSPISNLVNFLHLQKNEPGIFSAEQAAVHEKKIGSSAESLLETMEAMLLWSKGQMENFKPEIKSVAVNDLFNYLGKFFATTENVQFTFNNPQNVLVNTDENYLQTIMHNLTANAIKALKNTPNATVGWNVIQEGDKISLSITDNGPGLSTDQSKAMYEDAIVTNSKTGLGLHIIRDLAKAIQCKISVQSNPGLGTTFTLAV